MSGTSCSCGAPPLPHTRLCFACGVEAKPPRSLPSRIEISSVRDQQPLVEVLAPIVVEPREVVAALVESGRFELAGTLTAEQRDRLCGWIEATGARARANDRFVTGAELKLSWQLDRALQAKTLVTALVGGAGALYAVPLVPAAAAAAAVWLALQAVRIHPVALSLEPTAGDDKLEVVDRLLLDETLRVRKTLTDAETLAAVHAVMLAYAELAAALSADGLHLVRAELRQVDARLRELVRHAHRAALSLQRIRLDVADPERQARARSTRAEIMTYLGSLPARFDDLRARTSELHRADARRDLLVGPFASIWEMKGQVEAAIEIAEL